MQRASRSRRAVRSENLELGGDHGGRHPLTLLKEEQQGDEPVGTHNS